jgi:putative hydrolase of the HAD superfamily
MSLAIVWDIGGVVVHPDTNVLTRALAEVADLHPDPEAVATSLYEWSNAAFSLGVPADSPGALCALARALGIVSVGGDVLLAAYALADRTMWSVIDEDAVTVLSHYRDRSIAQVALSNANGDLESSLSKKRLLAYFDAVLDSSVTGLTKPDARAYELAARAAQVNVSECIFVGDSMAEVRAAEVVGFKGSYLYQRGLDHSRFPQNGSDFLVIDNLLGLLDYVRLDDV